MAEDRPHGTPGVTIGLRAAAAAALLAVAPATGAAPAQGPLEVRTPGTLRDLFLDMVLWDAREVSAPRLQVAWALANDWSAPTLLTRGIDTAFLQLDEQADSLTAQVRIPWGAVAGAPEGSFLRRLSSALEVRGTVHWGGWTDAIIEGWHRALNYNRFDRDQFPRNEVHVTIANPNQPGPVRLTGTTVAFGDLVLRNQLLLWQGAEPLVEGPPARAGVSLRLDVKAPTGSLARMGGSGGWDLGLGLAGTWQATSWLVGHAMVSGSLWTGNLGGLAMAPRRWHASLELSLVFLVGEVALFVEDRWATPVFESGWEWVDVSQGWVLQSTAWPAAQRAQNQITLGVRWGPLSFWLMEDFTLGYMPKQGAQWFYNTNAPDLALGLTFAWPL
jgi:hypothetical protein